MMKQNRRSFISNLAYSSLGLTIAPHVARAQTAPRRFIIDAHQHYNTAPDYMERLVNIYRPRNAMACILTPIAGFEVVRKAAAAHPDVVIPYGHVNVDNPHVAKEIQQFADAGFKGIKMHTPKHNWDDFGYFQIYEKLQALKLVALFHTGIVSGSK